MPDGVLLDTSFLITFADSRRPHHAVARQYFKHFADEGIPMFLSTIVVSEFCLMQPATDLPLDAMIMLPYNLGDAEMTAKLNFKKHTGAPDESRAILKDDFKLLGQAKAGDIAFLITEDARTLHKYCRELHARGEISTKPIKLEDGFDKSHFDPNGQLDIFPS